MAESDAQQQKLSILRDLNNYQSHGIADYCLRYLTVAAEAKIEAAARQPWTAVLLLKWLYSAPEFTDVFRPAATTEEITKLLNRIRDLQKLQGPSEFHHHSQYFRCVAFQQFYFQQEFSNADYARQYLLFGPLQENHRLARTFRDATALELETYLDLSLCLLTLLLEYRHNLTSFRIEFFAPFFRRYGFENVLRYLNNMSGDRWYLAEYLPRSTALTRPEHEQFEQSPFIRIPLIRWNKYYRVVNRPILERHLENTIYDTFKENDPEKFMNNFGPIFESHVARCIGHSNISHTREAEIQAKLSRQKRAVDFVLRETEETCMLIDAKAVEMGTIAQTTDEPDIVYRGTKSIIKGIEQGLSTVQSLEEAKLADPILKQASNYFLVIVTFKEMYLRNGKEYAEAIAPESVARRYSSYPLGGPKLPPENIFFITISDLEIVSELVRTKKTRFEDILQACKTKDSGPPGTGNFVFRQHLFEQFGGELDYPQFVLNALDEPFSRILDKT